MQPKSFKPIPEEFEIFVGWIREREAIRVAKESGAPRPWTKDPLLQKYRWCNVSRMDDRVSRELFRDWYVEASPRTQLTAAALGRLVNWPESLLDATGGKPFTLADLPRVRAGLHARADKKQKVFTGAYLIPGTPGRNKVDSILDLVSAIDAAADTVLQPTLRDTWQALRGFHGLAAGFLAGQITADMAYLTCGAKWPDRFSWAPVGPGSTRGMNRLLGRPRDRDIPQAQFDVELRAYTDLVRPRIEDIFVDRKLGAQDLQGTLCEADKMRRLQLSQGKVRATFDGASEPQPSLF